MKNNKELDEFATCRRFVRMVKRCSDCLHFAECQATGQPVALASREFAEVSRMVERVNAVVFGKWLPSIKVTNIKATAACKLTRCNSHKFCVAIAYNDRSYDYLKFNEKPSLNKLTKVCEISIFGHFGKDITK